MKYVENIDQVFAEEIVARHQLISGSVTLPNGTVAEIEYPKLDMGEIQNAFDGLDESLIRTDSANPMNLNLKFSQPFTVKSVTLRLGGAPTTVQIEAIPADGSDPVVLKKLIPVSGDYRNLTLSFDQTQQVSALNILVKNTDDGEPSHVHLWEVTFK